MRSIPSTALVLLLVVTMASAGCTLPLRSNDAAAAPAVAPVPAGCARVDVTSSPSTLHPGQQAYVRAVLTNACNESFQVQSRNGCEQGGLDLAIAQPGKLWRFRGPDASAGRACPAGKGPVVTLQPGDAINATWVWDGTFSDAGCTPGNGTGCGAHYAASPGSYQLLVLLMGKTVGQGSLEIARP